LKELIIILLSFIIYSNQLFSQCSPCSDPPPLGVIDYNSARLSLLTGSNLNFNFSSLNDYKNGITLEDFTVLGITICDCTSEIGADPVAGSTITGWDLYMDTDEPFLNGSPGNTLPLCFLEAEASTRNGLVGVNYTGRQTLRQHGSSDRIAFDDSSPFTISNRFWASDQMNISYYLAVPPTNADCIADGYFFPLINSNVIPDYYTITISFTLVPRCTACVDTHY
jgi:hypothetical protein